MIGVGLGWWIKSPVFVLAGLALGPVVGWFLGLLVVLILCRIFMAPDGQDSAGDTGADRTNG